MLDPKTKIKHHVKRRGHHSDFDITPTFIHYWWRRLNFALFNSKLILPKKVIIKNFRDDVFGWCTHSIPVKLGIRTSIGSRKEFLTVLTHEMVHAWEVQTFGRATHGKNFMCWEIEVKQLGLPLGEYID